MFLVTCCFRAPALTVCLTCMQRPGYSIWLDGGSLPSTINKELIGPTFKMLAADVEVSSYLVGNPYDTAAQRADAVDSIVMLFATSLRQLTMAPSAISPLNPCSWNVQKFHKAQLSSISQVSCQHCHHLGARQSFLLLPMTCRAGSATS